MIVLAVKIHRETSDLCCTGTYISAEGKKMMSVDLYLQVHEHIKNHLHTLTLCTLIIHESSYNLIDGNYTKYKMFVFSLSTHSRPMCVCLDSEICGIIIFNKLPEM